ncbi:MAG: hypothetical protein K9G11_02755, partial [Rickettsiaceae bacterium]|nr:hypothetical protein [Rickettsiaceae bacterium]
MKIKNFGTFIKLFLLYLCILYCSTNSSILADNSPDDAMDDETKHPKIKAPSFNNGGVTVSGSQSVELDGKWISLATNIQNGKMVMLQLYGDRVYEFPRQYKVIYRIDPRFIEPQIFVLQFNYTTGNYELINESALLSELSGNDSFGQKASALASIFNNTQLIPVNAGDVVNIQLAQNAPNISNLTPSSLTSGMLDISTASTNLLNKIIYVNSSTICENYKITSTNYGCSSGEYFAVPGNNADGYNLLYGNIADSSLVD